MSVQATTAVWEHSKARGWQFVVLLAIADAANADGENASPGGVKLVRWCRKTRQSVWRSIKALEELGELERTGEPHRGSASIFAVILPGLGSYEKRHGNATHSDQESVAFDAGKRRVSERKRRVSDPNASRLDVTPSHKPPNKPPKELSTRARDLHFDEFWKHYPRRHGKKVGKGDTEVQWERLSTEEQERALIGVQHYRSACDADLTLAKDPFRWLQKKAFDDWQTPAQPRGPKDRFVDQYTRLNNMRQGVDPNGRPSSSTRDEARRSLPA